MAKMKSTKKYYFSVEGETEQWYLKWLQDRINETEEAKIKVSFDCPVQKNPLTKRVIAIIKKFKIAVMNAPQSIYILFVKSNAPSV